MFFLNQICEANNAHLSHSGWLTNPKARKQRQLVTQGWSRPRSTHLGRIAMSVTLDQECYYCYQGYLTKGARVIYIFWYSQYYKRCMCCLKYVAHFLLKTHLGRIAMSVTLDQEYYQCYQGYFTRVISVDSVI